MLAVTILYILCCIFFSFFFNIERKLYKARKILEEAHHYYITYNMYALDKLLKSKKAKYLTDHDKFTYSEYVRMVNNSYIKGK